MVGGELMPTGAIYGFLNILMRVYRRYGGVVEVAWEGKRSRNFRRALYPGYKARTEPDETLALFLAGMNEQERRLKAILRALGIRQHEGAGGEADDVLAMLASRRRGNVIVYTGDSDLRQLSDERVTIVAPGFRGEDVVYTPEKVKERHGVDPCFIPDLKALGGDTGDGIPGVKGIGPKTAAQLVAAYGNVEFVIKAAEGWHASAPWPVAERFKKIIVDSKDDIRLFRQLTIVDPERGTREIERKRDKEKAMAYFGLYKFRTLMQPSEFFDIWRMGGASDDE